MLWANIALCQAMTAIAVIVATIAHNALLKINYNFVQLESQTFCSYSIMDILMK
jgi:hypothetical protein